MDSFRDRQIDRVRERWMHRPMDRWIEIERWIDGSESSLIAREDNVTDDEYCYNKRFMRACN